MEGFNISTTTSSRNKSNDNWLLITLVVEGGKGLRLAVQVVIIVMAGVWTFASQTCIALIIF